MLSSTLVGQSYLDFTEDFRMTMSDALTSAATLRQVYLALQHPGRKNTVVGFLPELIVTHNI